jgi:hypothetical protein
MSEYQYYEFRAIDRQLSEREMAELGELSSRGEITPTSFTNTYNYGSFKGNPEALMERHFDAFVYIANWGNRRLMFRIPRRFLDVKAARVYCDDHVFSLRARKDHVVLEFNSEDEPDGGWTNGDRWMPALVGVRAELLRGDFRALYIAWLASIPVGARIGEDGCELEEFEDGDRLEPPVPRGLAKLSAPLKALAEFLRVDDELIEAAAAASAEELPAEPSRAALARWIEGLSVADKDAYLKRFVAAEGDALLRVELSKRFLEAIASGRARRASAQRRTVAQLCAARAASAAEKQPKAAKRASTIETRSVKIRAGRQKS